MRKLPHLRWYIAGLLFTSTVINYIDRQTIAVVKPRILSDLHLSQIQYGHIIQAWLLAYTIMYVLSGFLVDRWGTRKALAAFVGWWSTANILHIFARSGGLLEFFQTLLGIGEPGNYNAAVRATSEWYPPRERAFLNGLVNAGSALGAIIAMPLVAFLEIRYGWRYAFVFTGALGLVWLVPWLLFYRMPGKHTRITDAELEYIKSGPPILCPDERPTVAELMRRADIWGLMLARFFSDPVWWFYLFWLPGYLQESRGFTLEQIAFFGWLPYLASDIGGMAGGWISDRTIDRAGSPVRARMWPMALCAALMPVSLMVPHLHTRAWLIAILCVVTFAHMAWKTNLMTITNDVYPTECIGTVFGVLMVGSGLGGFLFQGIVGHLVQHGSYKGIFVMMGFMHPLSFVCCFFLLRKAKLLRRTKSLRPAIT